MNSLIFFRLKSISCSWKNIFFYYYWLLYPHAQAQEETLKVEIPSDLDTYSVNSHLRKFSVNVPENWKNISDNVETIFDIWLISSDDKTVIGFIPLNIDSNIDEDDKLKLLSKFELEALKSKNADINTEDIFTLIEIDGITAAPLTYEIDGKKFNLIVFGKDNVITNPLLILATAINRPMMKWKIWLTCRNWWFLRQNLDNYLIYF